MSAPPKIHLRAEPGGRLTRCGLLVEPGGPAAIDDVTEVTCRSCLKNHGDLDRESRPADSLAARWTALREIVKMERDAQDDLAAEHAEYGRDARSEQCYAEVKTLDWVLATMDRMEGGQ